MTDLVRDGWMNSLREWKDSPLGKDDWMIRMFGRKECGDAAIRKCANIIGC